MKKYSGTLDSKISQREIEHSKIAKEIACEGIVLLKNEGVLPLCADEAVALLGNGANKTVKGGIGSGDVNNRYNISIYEGLIEQNVNVVSKDWIMDYDTRYDNARKKWKEKILEDTKKVDNPFDAYADNPFSFPEGRPVTYEDIAEAKVVLYVVSRISGEGKDRRLEAGDYYLSQREKEDIVFICQHKPMILLINAGGSIELTDVLFEQENIRAVLNISQLGQEGGRAVADVLLGKVSPSGKLTATWAKRYTDYPFSSSFSYLNGNLEYDEYKEGIFVGYRYFSTFDVEPLFPFGHGLSYADFSVSMEQLQTNGGKISIDVSVKNIGTKYSGKEVVQCYVILPEGKIVKEKERLVGFTKSKLLAPNEEQKVTISIEQKMLASYCEECKAWVLEKGDYIISLGNSSKDKENVCVVRVLETVRIEETQDLFMQQHAVKELTNDASEANKNMVNDLPVFDFAPEIYQKSNYNLKSISPEAVKIASEIPVEKLIPLLIGNITKGASTLGSAGTRVPGSAGETSEVLEDDYDLPSLIMADGPAGIRLRQQYEVNNASGAVYGVGVLGSLDNGYIEPIVTHDNASMYYQYCTAFPVGTAVAQTWNKELMLFFGEAIAKEMKEFGVNLWLAPGLNIQRNPLCGRNFEYYSEDPYLSGTIAAEITKGVQSESRCGVTIKHFACNNQEDNRMGVDARLSQRALREIYLRGFEIAVKEGKPIAMMTSYNLINGVHAANSKDLCTHLAREEWNFDGLIMSDWNTTVPEDGSIPWKCVNAGNDIIMPGNMNDENNIISAYKNGDLSEENIRACASRIISVILRL